MTKSALPRLVMAGVCAAVLVAGRAEALNTGDPAPELQATDWINGGPISIAGSAGHVVVVEFWATW